MYIIWGESLWFCVILRKFGHFPEVDACKSWAMLCLLYPSLQKGPVGFSFRPWSFGWKLLDPQIRSRAQALGFGLPDLGVMVSWKSLGDFYWSSGIVFPDSPGITVV